MLIPAILAMQLIASPPPQDVPKDTPKEEQRSAQTERGQKRSSDRNHTFGIGGQLGVSNRGAGAGTRFFFGDHLGVNLQASWYKNGNRYTVAGTNQGSTFAALPSFIYMLTKPDSTREVDLRPYVGGGINYVSTSRPATSLAGNSATQRYNGVGGQAFGGVEMTFKDTDWMTISAEGIYYKLPINYVNAATVGGFNYLLGFHFYLK